jgi:hypothetical protein
MSNGGFFRFLTRVTACHIVTYFVAGVLAYTLLDYRGLFSSAQFACYMRPIDSRWVAAGPALQVIRGVIFAMALYPFRHVFLDAARGWLPLWGLLVGLAVLSTAGPCPGSVEGMIYTQVPALSQLRGLPEVMAQTLVFSWLLVGWYRRPHRAWGLVIGTLAVLGVLMSLAGALLPRP